MKSSHRPNTQHLKRHEAKRKHFVHHRADIKNVEPEERHDRHHHLRATTSEEGREKHPPRREKESTIVKIVKAPFREGEHLENKKRPAP